MFMFLFLNHYCFLFFFFFTENRLLAAAVSSFPLAAAVSRWLLLFPAGCCCFRSSSPNRIAIVCCWLSFSFLTKLCFEIYDCSLVSCFWILVGAWPERPERPA